MRRTVTMTGLGASYRFHLSSGIATRLPGRELGTSLVLGFASPLAVEASARRERSLKVGLYLERRFDGAREAEP